MITQEEVFRDWAKRKRRIMVMRFVFYPGLLVIPSIFVSRPQKDTALLLSGVFIAFFVIVTIATNVIWSCPACKCWLRKAQPNFCPRCGVKLETQAERIELSQQPPA